MTSADFDELFVEQYPKLVALGVSMTGDREVSRELAQESMIRAHHQWDEVQRYDAPQAWLRRVMSNLLIDHHRSRTAERSAVDRLAASIETTTQQPRSTPWAELIEPLTSRQRLVATLYYADDLSVGEIADALEVSAGTVKSTLAKVRRRLQSHQPIIDQRGATT